MGGGYNPGPYGGTPVGKGEAKLNYLTSALSGLEKGYQQKRQREGGMLEKQVELAKTSLDEARANVQKYASDPNLSEQMKKAEADATENYEKLKGKVQKHFGADPTVFSALWNKLKTQKGSPQAAGTPPGANPVSAPVPSGVNQAAPPAAGGKPQQPSVYTAMANFDTAKALTEATSQADVAKINAAENAKKQRVLDEQQAQVQRQQALTATLKPMTMDLIKTPPDQFSTKLPAFIQGTYDATRIAYPVDSLDPSDPGYEQKKMAFEKAPAEHAISALDALKRRPEMKDQVGWIESQLADYHGQLAGMSNKANPQDKLSTWEQKNADRSQYYRPGVPPSQQPPEWQADMSRLAQEDKASEKALGNAKQEEIRAHTHRLNEQAKAGAKGKPETTRTLADRAARISASVYASMYSGTTDAGMVSPTAKLQFEKDQAKAFIDENPSFAAKMRSGEDPLAFINRMRNSPAEPLAIPAPVPGASQIAPATPPAGAVPPAGLGPAAKAGRSLFTQ